MFTIFQSLASHSYTFREVAAYVTIAVCMSFAVGFLIAAYTRIFNERKDRIDILNHRVQMMDMGGLHTHSSDYDRPHFSDNFHEERGDID